MGTLFVLVCCLFIQYSFAVMTNLTIKKTNFYINEVITYSNCSDWTHTTKGLLLNSRMIQGVFDDANSSTVNYWDYPDTKKWDSARNTNEFVGNMSLWNSYGLLAFTVGLQGGGPGKGYPNPQPWIVSAFDFKSGALNTPFISRLDQILQEADKLAMVPIVQFFYWGQSSRFNKNNAAINASITNIIDWLLNKQYSNLLIDVANECTSGHYDGTILHCNQNMSVTITNIKGYIKEKTGKNNSDLGIYFGSSINSPPTDNLISASDFVLMHGNSKNTTEMQDMINTVRASDAYKAKPMPIVYNEDPNFHFDDKINNMEVAVTNHASWGFYDQGNNDYHDGYQSPPTDWKVDTNDKTGFFNKVKEYSGV
eukprot:556508_1